MDRGGFFFTVALLITVIACCGVAYWYFEGTKIVARVGIIVDKDYESGFIFVWNGYGNTIIPYTHYYVYFDNGDVIDDEYVFRNFKIGDRVTYQARVWK